MAREMNKLTAKEVEAASYQGKPFKLFDGGGLFLHVQRQGKYWRLKYRWQGREKLLALGVFPEVKLAEARRRRDDAREQIGHGVDPSAERQAQKKDRAGEETFRAVAEEWLKRKAPKLAENTLTLARRRLERYVFPFIGDRRIQDLEPPDILGLLRPLDSAGKHETAHRMRQRIGEVFRYAVATGRVDRDPTADLKGALSPVVRRNRAAITEPSAVGELLRAIEGFQGQPGTRAALHVLALTFLRPGELRGARWDEIDFDNAIWRIPAKRMKMNREHLVPLSRQAMEWLEEMAPVSQGYVFEGARPGRPLSENTLNAALRTLGYDGNTITAHGFRAMASTLLHELGWPPEVIELQLAHAQRSQVAAAYNRSARLEERRDMLQHWANYLDQLREGAGESQLFTQERDGWDICGEPGNGWG